jgi:hypothetical protein
MDLLHNLRCVMRCNKMFFILVDVQALLVDFMHYMDSLPHRLQLLSGKLSYIVK